MDNNFQQNQNNNDFYNNNMSPPPQQWGAPQQPAYADNRMRMQENTQKSPLIPILVGCIIVLPIAICLIGGYLFGKSRNNDGGGTNVPVAAVQTSAEQTMPVTETAAAEIVTDRDGSGGAVERHRPHERTAAVAQARIRIGQVEADRVACIGEICRKHFRLRDLPARLELAANPRHGMAVGVEDVRIEALGRERAPRVALRSGVARHILVFEKYHPAAEVAMAMEEMPSIEVVYPEEGAYLFFNNWVNNNIIIFFIIN